MIDIYNTGYIRRYYLLESLIIKGCTCYFPNSILKVMALSELSVGQYIKKTIHKKNLNILLEKLNEKKLT